MGWSCVNWGDSGRRCHWRTLAENWFQKLAFEALQLVHGVIFGASHFSLLTSYRIFLYPY